jgi:hypothetical protein
MNKYLIDTYQFELEKTSVPGSLGQIITTTSIVEMQQNDEMLLF